MIWLSTKEAAELLGYEQSTIRKKAKNSEYIHRYIPSATGQGGKKLEILLESLPEQAQKAYHNKNGECQTVFNTDYTSTNKQKEKGTLRRLAVSEWGKFKTRKKKEGMKKTTEITNLFVENWNKEHDDLHISSKLLYEWKKR